MLTTTVDGLWVLQVLAGIEVLAPELGLRPTLPSVETTEMALAHPMAAELRAQQVIDAAGVVDSTVLEWLTVLARRDMALLLQVSAPSEDMGARAQGLLARFAQWWVSIERSGEVVRLGGAGTSETQTAASALVQAQIARLCGILPPVHFQPVTLESGALRAAAASPTTLHDFLQKQPLGAKQLRVLLAAADPEQSVQVSIVALQTGIETGRPTRTHIEPGAVTVIDTREGRVVVEHGGSAGGQWTVLGPGTARNIEAAVTQMMRRLPAGERWHSYRRVR